MPKKQKVPERVRRLGTFFEKAELARNNPQSLRRVLYDLTTKKFDHNLKVTASELKAALRTRHGRTLHSTLSKESLFNILSDRTHIKYYHLEAYARKLGIPVSLIVLYSRLTANQQDRTPQLNEAMLNAFSRIIRSARKKLAKGQLDPKLFQIEDLLGWIAMYSEETSKAENPRLFPRMSDE
jgi:hypothetical protein